MNNLRQSSGQELTRRNRAKVRSKPIPLKYPVDPAYTHFTVDVQREATHFKNRVLDLIETFFRKNSTSPLIIKLIAPILELITGTGTDERQLSDKAKGILRSKIAKAKDVPTGVDVEQVKTILDDLHVRARKVHSSDLLAALSQCSVYLSRALLLAGAEDAVVQAYRQSLADFITRKNSALNTNFFQELIRRCPASGWQLRGDLIDLVDKGVNVFRQSQAFQLVETLVIQFPAMVSLYCAFEQHLMKYRDRMIVLWRSWNS